MKNSIFLFLAICLFQTVRVYSQCSINLSTSGNDTLCTNINSLTVLTATASPSGGTYNWSPGGGTGPSIVVSPAVNTIYTVVYTDSLGCSVTQTLAITVLSNCCPQTPTLVLSSDTTLCANDTSGVVLSASAFPNPVSYSWLPGPLSGPSVLVNPTVTTNYIVSVTYSNGCVVEDTVAVTVFTNCCPTSTITNLGLSVLNNISINGPVIITNNITVTGGVSTLQNGAFLISPGVKITIDPGSQLNLNGAHLYACGLNMWQGIDVLDGGRISGGSFGSNVTLIEDAMTAITLDSINVADSIPVDLDGVIFNKNHTGIRFSNGSVTSLNVRLKSCVFTSRSLPYTLSSWPGSSTGAPNLRYTTPAALADVSAPFGLQGYGLSNLKAPYSSQSSQTGIDIQNINNVAGNSPSPGININSWYAMADSTFNLFDMQATGIRVEDASLTTMNNVFQNMLYFSGSGGTGIHHSVTGLMNARLSLSPQLVTPSLSNGNRFWDCYQGIEADHVYEFDMDYGLIRSSQTTPGGGFVPGFRGIYLNSNRFDYRIMHNEFNNINTAIDMSFADNTYDMGSGSTYGIFGTSATINENYFGPQVSSSTFMGSNYLNNAVSIYAPNSSSFAGGGTGIFVQSNKINRAYRGISVKEMAGFPVDISANLINLENDITFGSRQYGIQAVRTIGMLRIIENDLSGTSIGNTLVSLVYCELNSGSNSPEVTCNSVSTAYNGFEFNQNNSSTIWKGNSMFTLRRGLLLRNNGSIGPQGNITSPSGNRWLGVWPTANFGTYTDLSNAASSILFVNTAGFPWYPPNNSGTSVPSSYAVPGSIVVASSGNYNCVPLGLPNPPSNKTMNELTAVVSEKELVNGSDLQIYPNPATDRLFIKTPLEKENFSLIVYDIGGKKVFDVKGHTVNQNSEIEISLEQGLYLVEIKTDNAPAMFKKIVINR